MGLFDHFPYTNVHELNLDWVLSMMRALEAEWEAYTAGNSLTFADPMLHDISKTYAKNTIVLDGNGNAYVSLQAVPVGVTLSNQDYWLMVFDYEAFIEKVNKNFTARYYRDQYRATAAMVIGDWLTVDDVLCKATAAIAIDDVLEIGVNIEHFTLEDFIKAFMLSANQLIQQYKNDIDASELLYRQQLAGDIASTTASLQAQLDAAISGATVDSEVINGRVTWYGKTSSTIGDAIRKQTNDLADILSYGHISEKDIFTTSSPYTHDFKFFPVKAGDRVKFSTDATAAGGISTRLGDGTVIESFTAIAANSSSTVTITSDANFIDAYMTAAGTITVEILNNFRADIAQNTSDIAQNTSDISDLQQINSDNYKKVNLLEMPESITHTSRVNPTTGAVEYGYTGWDVYEMNVAEGEAYHITRTSDSISMIWYYDNTDTPIDSLYNLGLTQWNSDFIVPAGAVKLRLTLSSAYQSTGFVGCYMSKWNDDQKTALTPAIILPHQDYVTIGSGGDYDTITAGFAAARALNTGAIILAGNYNLISEGISGYGLVCPKHVIGYGAKIKMILPSEDWNISPFNMPLEPECIIEGVEIEVTNGRYCIHDEMYNYAPAYHHVIKNCKLIHNSPSSAILLAPRAIGGGIGNSGVVEIYNNYIESQLNYGDLAYHSNGAGSQTGEVYVHVHDNDIKHAIQFSRSGSDSSYMNVGYVSNNRFGTTVPTNMTDTNISMICWNNVLA